MNIKHFTKTSQKREKNDNLYNHISDYKPKIPIIIGPIEAIYRGTDSVHYRAIESNWHVTFPVSDKGTYILCVFVVGSDKVLNKHMVI